jgi:biotin carboxylase
MKKTLLVLGAGIDQTYPIIVAQQSGLRVLAADSNPNAQGFSIADEVANVSNRDVDGLKALCDESARFGNSIEGILVMGTDIPDVAAELALYLKIPGPSIYTGKSTTDKFIMKEILSQNGIAVPWYALVENFDSLRNLMLKHKGNKFVIKPTDRSGARGVFVISPNMQDLEDLYNESIRESNSGKVIIEEFIDGDQISTESILWKGKAFTPGFVDRNYEMLDRFAPSVIENGGNHPSKIVGERRSNVERLVEAAARALGIINGVVKGDVVITNDGKPMIIEVAARLSGGDFSESLIPLGCGVNIVKEAIKVALGVSPNVNNLSDKWEQSVANRYFFGEPGILKSIIGLDDVKRLPWLKKFEIWVKPGDEIKQIKFHADRLGVFIVCGDCYEETQERIQIIYNLVKFNILENNA